MFDNAAALKTFNSVRVFLRERLALSTRHPIMVELIGLDRLKALSAKGPGGGVELGLFEYTGVLETRVSGEVDAAGNMRKLNESSRRVDETWRIYALYGLPEERLFEVFAHELAHDWMQESCPGVNDPKIKEGWAEYIAWRVNGMLGRDALNARIERCQDSIYGDGFRMMKGIADREGFDGLKARLRKGSQ